MKDKSFSDLISGPPTVKKSADPDDVPFAEEEIVDVGTCAAIAKSKWVTALTIKHREGKLESFQYSGMMTRSVYEPTGFWVRFSDHDEKQWNITVTGRNLETIYNLVVQHRMEWLRVADRDFAEGKQPIITGIAVKEEKEEK